MTPARSKKNVKAKAKTRQAEQYQGNYNSASWTDRRIQFYGTAPSDNRNEVTQSTRFRLLQKARYAEKNYASMTQYALDMVTYVVGDGIMPNSHAQDEKKAKQYVNYYLRKMRKPTIDGRWSYGDAQKIKVHTWCVDGELFVVSVEDRQGEIKQQIIEAHRCVNPADAQQGEGWSDGFKFGSYGEVLEYNFKMDDGSDRRVPADKVRHISKATRASAAHGLPPLAQALNTMQDQAEVFEMEKTAVKDVSDIPRVITKAGGTLDQTTAGEVTGNSSNPYDSVSQKMGGKLLVLDTGEKLEYPVPTRGTNVWIGFNDALQRMICAGGLPYEFVHDSTKAGSGTIRMTLGKAGRYVGSVQTMLIEDDLTPSWNEIIAKGISDGELPDDPEWMEVSWTCPPAPSIDNGRDASNDREDLKLGLTSFTELYKRRAGNFEADSEQLARDIALLRRLEEKYKLPVNTLSQRYNTLPFNDQQITSITQANPEPLQQ